MESLEYSFIASLIPSAALLGVLFAWLRRKQPIVFQDAAFWLALTAATLAVGLGPVVSRKFNQPISFASLCAFTFVFPPCVYYWLRFQKLNALLNVGTFKLMSMVLSFLAVLGIFWFCLVFGLSMTIISKVWHAFD
jgi:hypothetical protein